MSRDTGHGTILSQGPKVDSSHTMILSLEDEKLFMVWCFSGMHSYHKIVVISPRGGGLTMQGRSRLEKPKAPHRDFGKVPGEDIVTVHTQQACTRGYPDDRGRLD